MKRALISLLVSAAMVIGPLPALSADTGPLPSGTAAGIKQAQDKDDSPPLLWLVGAGVVIAIGILLLSNNNNGGGGAPVAVATTTTTNPSSPASPTTPKAPATTTTNP